MPAVADVLRDAATGIAPRIAVLVPRVRLGRGQPEEGGAYQQRHHARRRHGMPQRRPSPEPHVSILAVLPADFAPPRQPEMFCPY